MIRAARGQLFLMMLTGWAFAQDGKVQYETYCGACHGPDGKGAVEGQFPPLAGSEWVKGPPSRMIQIVLHGLEGEVTVAAGGKPVTYNLAMPPQGAALTDEQIAAITTYVRSAWGNEGSAVTKEMIVAERKASAGRTQMWTGDEILDRYPLPGTPKRLGKIENLIARVYEGKFETLEDLRKAEPVTAEEEKGGVISLRHAGNRKDHFGVIWTGEVVAPVAGDYIFDLDADDGAAVFVDDKPVVEVKGIGPMGRMRRGRTLLEKGRHDLRVEYFEYRGNQGISLQWKGPQREPVSLSETKPRDSKPKHPSIPLVPPGGEAMIYRNFIAGTTPRAIGVGYDRGLNLAFSADNMAIELIWSGKFLDGGLHWTARGKGRAKPQGKAVKISAGPAFALLPDPGAKWPGTHSEALPTRFRGYTLNKKKQPTFHYNIGELELSDFPEPKGGEAIPGLARRITIEAGERPPGNLCFRVATGLKVKAAGTNGFRIGDRLFVQLSGNTAGQPVVRGNELILPLNLSPGTNRILLNYTLD